MARPEFGTKRVDPVTGRKFYDLNRDPVVSPYTGQSYPRSIFDPVPKQSRAAAAASDDDEAEVEVAAGAPEFVPLADAEVADSGKDVVIEDIEVEDDGTEADDTFLEEEEEDDGDVSDLIDGDMEDDEES